MWVNIALFEKFQKELGKDIDLKCLFPKTHSTLSSIGTDISLYEAYMMTLREAFKDDLSSLPAHISSIMDNHKDYFEKREELKAGLYTAFYIANAFSANLHPGEIIENYDVNTLNHFPSFKAAFQTLKLFSTSLHNTNGTSYWVSYPEIKRLVNDDVFLRIYMGLIYQQAKNHDIEFMVGSNPVYLHNLLKESCNDLTVYKTYLTHLAVKTLVVEKKINGLKQISNDSLFYENYYHLASFSIDLIKSAVETEKFIQDYDLNLEEQTNSFFAFAQASANMVIDVQRKNYSSAIVNITKFISLIDVSFTELAQKTLKYGSFMALVVQARCPEDIEKAIEAAALPTGSARLKRESRCNVSLNSYSGLFAGKESIKNADNSSVINTYGLTIPIGLSITLGKQRILPFVNGCRFNGHWSHSLFFSFLDIGTITAFRSAHDSLKCVPKIRLKNIISPGIYYSLGIAKSPVSLNIGCQIGPVLRDITALCNNYGDTYTRISISLCVDMPLIHFYSNPK